MEKTNLSIVVLTHNDELKIVDCLERLGFADEILVIDDNSYDRTSDLAKQFTSRIYKRKLEGNFANQRNYALNFAKGEWVLFIDSDEIVTKELEEEILRAIKSKEFAGYYLRRVDKMWGRKILHGEVGETRLMRLGKRRGGKWHGKVHETWKIIGKTGELISPLEHRPHSSVKDFLREIDEYSTLRASELKEKGVHTSAVQIIFFPIAKFIHNYFFRKGYKDGVPGLIYALMMSFHSFLVRGKVFLKK